jgi:hypothetical protein
MKYIVVYKKNLICLLYTGQVVIDKNFKITNIHRTNKKLLLIKKLKLTFIYEENILNYFSYKGECDKILY